MKNIIIIVIFLIGILPLKGQQAIRVDSTHQNMMVVISGQPAKMVEGIPFAFCQISNIGQDTAWVGRKLSVIRKDNTFYLKVSVFLPNAAKNVKTINGLPAKCTYYSATETQYRFLKTEKYQLLSQNKKYKKSI